MTLESILDFRIVREDPETMELCVLHVAINGNSRFKLFLLHRLKNSFIHYFTLLPNLRFKKVSFHFIFGFILHVAMSGKIQDHSFHIHVFVG